MLPELAVTSLPCETPPAAVPTVLCAHCLSSARSVSYTHLGLTGCGWFGTTRGTWLPRAAGGMLNQQFGRLRAHALKPNVIGTQTVRNNISQLR